MESWDEALRATKMIFATFESSRRRAHIRMPQEINDSPPILMIEG